MTSIHLLLNQTDGDRNRLYHNLKTQKNDFRIELIIFAVIWLVAPFLTNRPGQKPLIESMSYGTALLFFGLVFLIPLIVTYYKKIHKAVLACQTSVKRVVITEVTFKDADPLFRKGQYCLRVADKYLSKLYFPKNKFDQFEIGDKVIIEASEYAKQIIRIAKVREQEIKTLESRTSEYSSSDKLSYRSVLFSQASKDNVKLSSFFFFLIPSKHNFIAAIILDINILVFIIMLATGVSIYNPDVADIAKWGGNVRVLTIEHGELWRLVTNIFVHIGIVHLLMNAVGFVLVSIFAERILGRAWFLSLYLFTGICASVTSVRWHDNVVSAGASGAIFGLYGYVLALLVLTGKEERKINSGLIISVLIFIGYNLIMGLAGGIDNAAHIGGLVSGFVSGALLMFFGIPPKKQENNS